MNIMRNKEPKQKKSIRKIIKALFKFALVCAVIVAVLTLGLNLIVCLSSGPRMMSIENNIAYNASEGRDYDCIIVLGCGVRNGEPTPLLSDRLDAAIALYQAGVAPKVLMSGDHGQSDYDEVSAMRQYAMERGVPSEDIFMDHAGFSTYETMYRAKNIFGVENAVVVTQKYHLYRALYDARSLGIETTGTIAVGHVFASQPMWTAREILARVKDFVWCIVKPLPTFMGDTIDITGNGEVTLG